MPRPPGLFRRGSVWIFRKRVPPNLRGTFGLTEIKISLKTSDYAEARVAAFKLNAKWAARIAEARKNPSPLPRRRSAEVRFPEVLTQISQFYDRIEEHLQSEFLDGGDEPDPEMHERASECADHIAELRVSSAAMGLTVATRAQMIFGDEGLPPNLSPREFKEVSTYIVNREIAYEQEALRLWLGKPVEISSDVHPRQSGNISLAAVISEYLSDYERTSQVGRKRHEKVAASLNFVQDFFGNILLTHVTRASCREFRDFLNRMPSNYRKHIKDSSLSLREVATLGERLGLPAMKPNTQDTYLRALKMLLEWAVAEGYIAANPVENLKPLGIRQDRRAARMPFSSGDLQRIFNTPLYRAEATRDTKFWLPLIALFSGLRLNEICQLATTDLRSEEGIWYIDINADPNVPGKRLKNQFSRRRVPVHAELVRIGLIEMVRVKQLTGEVQLFPDLKLSRTEHRSDGPSKWFSRTFLRRCGIKTERLTFHSFRHTFRDALTNAGVTIEAVDAIGGWNTFRGSSSVYGGRPSIVALNEHMQRISYPGLDLTHLWVPKGKS